MAMHWDQQCHHQQFLQTLEYMLVEFHILLKQFL